MSKQILVNSSPYETRVATLEDGEIKSLHIEREEDRNVVGNIYKGLVKRVLPGMQAAFLELGLERTAFLYVDDIIDEPFGTEFDYGDTESDEDGDGDSDSSSDIDDESDADLDADADLEGDEEDDEGEDLDSNEGDEPGGEAQPVTAEGAPQPVALGPDGQPLPQAPHSDEESRGNRVPARDPRDGRDQNRQQGRDNRDQGGRGREGGGQQQGSGRGRDRDRGRGGRGRDQGRDQNRDARGDRGGRQRDDQPRGDRGGRRERPERLEVYGPHPRLELRDPAERIKREQEQAALAEQNAPAATTQNPEAVQTQNQASTEATNQNSTEPQAAAPSEPKPVVSHPKLILVDPAERIKREQEQAALNAEQNPPQAPEALHQEGEPAPQQEGQLPQGEGQPLDANAPEAPLANPRLELRDPIDRIQNAPDRNRNPEGRQDNRDNRDRGHGGGHRDSRRHGGDRNRGGRNQEGRQDNRPQGDRGQRQDNRQDNRPDDREPRQDEDRNARFNDDARFQQHAPGERDPNQGVEPDRHERNNEDPRLDRDNPGDRDQRHIDSRNDRSGDRNDDNRVNARGGGDRDRGGQGRGREGGRRDNRRGGSQGHRRGGRGGGGGGGGRSRRRERRNVEIQDLLKEGQELLVQVAKAPIGTKGARLTTHISLPGRNLVLMPTVKHLGISRRIESDRERRRLRDIFTKKIRTNGQVGFIIRTVAEGKSYRELKADADYLLQLWDQIQENTKKKKAPALIHEDLGLALKTMRDDFTDDVDSLVIDNQQDYENVLGFISQFSPRLKGRVKLFKGPSQLFEHYGIEAEISRALGKKVWLKSGGYLLIDQSEALTAIDVNTGRYVGSKSLEETILKTNLEAVKEISYQLRIRNIGGIIIIDLIDMENAQNRKKVYDALQEALSEDRAKTNILKISELGLVEMTRKRTHEDLVRYLTEQCGYCEGRGYHKSRKTICFEIFREIEKEAIATTHKNIVVFANSEVIGRITKEEKTHWKGLEERLQRQIVVKADPAFHVEQFEVFSKP